MERDVQRLLDERAIRRCLTDYCRGIDRLDADLLRSVYHADSTAVYGTYRGSGQGFVDYVIPRESGRWQATKHTISNSTIDFVDDDVANAETYVHAELAGADADGTFVVHFGGRYIDRFERRDGEWKIADRVVVHDLDRLERTEPAFPPDKFTNGRFDRDDPSYRR
ncbi:MAG TPA: nuclear transport factor 2 family protein [Ilumatobacteraceae bacterium]